MAIRGNGSNTDPNSPGFSRFFEDEDGQELSPDAKTQVFEDLYGFWLNTLKAGDPEKQLGNWSDIGLKLKEDFHQTLESKHPWLRLCDGQWKSKQLWVNYYGTWRKGKVKSPTPSDTRGNTKPTSNPKDLTLTLNDPLPNSPNSPIPNSLNDPIPDSPIEILFDTNETSTGSKRRRKDGDDPVSGPLSKCNKGKQPIVAPTAFHHEQQIATPATFRREQSITAPTLFHTGKPVPKKKAYTRKVSNY